MFCLDCGTKIDDDEPQCPHCGSSVAEMKERIAAAEETIAYTDAVAADKTSKLPLVAERTYSDAQGNPLDPSQAVDVSQFTQDPEDLRAIPEIGDDDPYLTKPMKRIVADSGHVVADVDRTPKEYRQDPPCRPVPVKQIVAAVAVVLVCVLAVANQETLLQALPASSQPTSSERAASNDGNSAAEPASDPAAEAREDLSEGLDRAYVDLSAWRDDVDDAVEGLEGYYRVKNRDTRTSYADKVVALIEEIDASRTKVKSLFDAADLEAGDDLVERYRSIDKLHGYLIDRLGYLEQCWEESLAFDSPAGHDSEILAPLRADIKGGSSASEAAFDKLYPQVA